MFVEAFFKLLLRLSNALFIASSSFYFVYNVSRIAVNAVVDCLCVSCRVKCVICLSITDVSLACTAAVVAATKGARRLVRGRSGVYFRSD